MKKYIIIFLFTIFIIGCKNKEEQKRNKNIEIIILSSKKEQSNMEAKQKTQFYEVFPEKVEIHFTPKDLDNTKDPKLLDFKKKLKAYEDDDPTIEGIGREELSTFISNNTSSVSEGYVDSSWLEYFLKKYDLHYTFNDLMENAINQEDFNAVNILIKKGYIFGKDEVELAKEVRNYSMKQIKYIKENEGLDEKGDVVLYDSSYSKFNEIFNLVNQKYNSNIIYDRDGYTNLREGAGVNFPIIAKIKSGEHIEVLDNPERKWELASDEESYNWYEVETKEGKKGYVHKSRIKSE